MLNNAVLAVSDESQQVDESDHSFSFSGIAARLLLILCSSDG